MLFKSKNRELIEQLASELTEAQQELQIERARRISAEAIAEERLKRCESAEDYARRAEKSRDEALSSRMTSLDLVNSRFLDVIGPDKPMEKFPENIKEAMKKTRLQATPIKRRMERQMIQNISRMPMRPGETPKVRPEHPEIEQLLDLNVDTLVG